MTQANPPTSQSEVITVEHQQHVAIVWLDRPDKLNALGSDFWIDFPAIMETLGADEGVRAIVLAGKGRAFTVGLDLTEFSENLLSGTVAGAGVLDRMTTYQEIKQMQRTVSSLADCPKPVVAAIHGWCLGGGVDLVTAADIRLAAADTTFSVRETKIALVADVGTLQRLPKIVDPGRVAELVYTGKDFGADEAAEMGLVLRVLPDREAVIKHALEVANEIASNSPLVVQAAKHILRDNAGLTMDEQLDYMALWNAAFLHSEDLHEAMKAMADDRAPEWSGR